MDARRGQVFTKLAREITVAVREGGPDPEANYRLRLAIQRARRENMPSENIERAIRRAAGAAEGEAFEEVYYEAYGPKGTAILIQALTDNRNRTVGELRSIITRGGGSMAEAGSVAWLFDQKGLIVVSAGHADPEDVALQAIDAGAEDVRVVGNEIEVYTEPSELRRVEEALKAAGLQVVSAERTMVPKALMSLNSEETAQVLRLLERIEELDDVQQVFTNLDIPDELAAVGSEA
jgi:YebC/PmpR family DNA-binding regulatory protein